MNKIQSHYHKQVKRRTVSTILSQKQNKYNKLIQNPSTSSGQNSQTQDIYLHVSLRPWQLH